MLIDTHNHLYSEKFDEDREEVVQRAIEAGVAHFFLPAIDSTYTDAMFSLEKKHPDKMHAMMGLHPTHVHPDTLEKELAHVKKWLDTRDFAAVGEIGIDLYWDKTHLREQQFAFKQQIDWAIEKDLPIVIHCRESFDEIFEVLEEKKHPKLRGIFHCFSGTEQQAQQAISYQMKLGIGGVLTFKNGKIDKFIHQIDLKHIVLETDAPYLAPTPHRGKRNEPSYVKLVAEKLSDIYQKPLEEIAQITTENAWEIFGK